MAVTLEDFHFLTLDYASWEEYNPYHWDWEFRQEIPADPASRTFDWWDAQLICADGPQLS